MVAGIVDHETGTRDLRKLSGLWAFMPHTATLAMIAAASMAGVPLLNGFYQRDVFERALDINTLSIGILIPILATISGIFSVAYSLKFVHNIFFNGKQKITKNSS